MENFIRKLVEIIRLFWSLITCRTLVDSNCWRREHWVLWNIGFKESKSQVRRTLQIRSKNCGKIEVSKLIRRIVQCMKISSNS